MSRLAASVVSQHLADDPVLLFLQAVAPAALRRASPSAGACAAGFRRTRVAVPVIARRAQPPETTPTSKRRLRSPPDGPAEGERARRLADVALAAEPAGDSDDFLAKAGNAPRPEICAGHAACGMTATSAKPSRPSTAPARQDGGSGPASPLRRRSTAGAAPSLQRQDFEPVPGRVLHLLTNSLPHTASGYAQRSHSITGGPAGGRLGRPGRHRMGYPVQVGKLLAQGHRRRGRRPVPAAPARHGWPTPWTPGCSNRRRNCCAVALEFRPSVLHTTTHYVNGLVVRAVAEALGIPWVYEVRGQLADTWAATRGT